jgi:hypothetical protein
MSHYVIVSFILIFYEYLYLTAVYGVFLAARNESSTNVIF